MRKIIFSGLFMLLLFGACTHVPKATQPVNRAERILKRFHNPKSDYVVVIATGEIGVTIPKTPSRHRVGSSGWGDVVELDCC